MANHNGPMLWPAMRGPSGPPEPQGHDDRRVGDQGGVLGQVEPGEVDRGVLQVVAAGQLLLGLDQVEGRPGHLGGDGDDEQGERDQRGAEDVPVVEEPAVLGGHDGAGAQRAGDQHDRRDGQARAPPRRTPSGRWPAPSRAAGTSIPTPSRPASRRRPRCPSIISRKRIPHGGSASCRRVVWPATVMVPPMGTMAKTSRAGTEHQVRGGLVDDLVRVRGA